MQILLLQYYTSALYALLTGSGGNTLFKISHFKFRYFIFFCEKCTRAFFREKFLGKMGELDFSRFHQIFHLERFFDEFKKNIQIMKKLLFHHRVNGVKKWKVYSLFSWEIVKMWERMKWKNVKCEMQSGEKCIPSSVIDGIPTFSLPSLLCRIIWKKKLDLTPGGLQTTCQWQARLTTLLVVNCHS